MYGMALLHWAATMHAGTGSCRNYPTGGLVTLWEPDCLWLGYSFNTANLILDASLTVNVSNLDL